MKNWVQIKIYILVVHFKVKWMDRIGAFYLKRVICGNPSSSICLRRCSLIANPGNIFSSTASALSHQTEKQHFLPSTDFCPNPTALPITRHVTSKRCNIPCLKASNSQCPFPRLHCKIYSHDQVFLTQDNGPLIEGLAK